MASALTFLLPRMVICSILLVRGITVSLEAGGGEAEAGGTAGAALRLLFTAEEENEGYGEMGRAAGRAFLMGAGSRLPSGILPRICDTKNEKTALQGCLLNPVERR